MDRMVKDPDVKEEEIKKKLLKEKNKKEKEMQKTMIEEGHTAIREGTEVNTTFTKD